MCLCLGKIILINPFCCSYLNTLAFFRGSAKPNWDQQRRGVDFREISGMSQAQVGIRNDPETTKVKALIQEMHRYQKGWSAITSCFSPLKASVHQNIPAGVQ